MVYMPSPYHTLRYTHHGVHAPYHTLRYTLIHPGRHTHHGTPLDIHQGGIPTVVHPMGDQAPLCAEASLLPVIPCYSLLCTWLSLLFPVIPCYTPWVYLPVIPWVCLPGIPGYSCYSCYSWYICLLLV